MTILWCGGEELDFVNTSTSVSYYTYYNSDYARQSLAPNSEKLSSLFPNGGIEALWLHFMVKRPGTGAYTGVKIAGVRDIGGSGIDIRNSVSTSDKLVLYIQKSGVSTILQTEAGNSLEYNAYTSVDVDIQAIGASSIIKVYANGNLIIDYAGDLSSYLIGSFCCACINGLANWINLSEIIVADEDTRLMRLKTLAPSAAGDSSTNWTGAYTDIDEIVLSDSDKIYSATDNADFQCNMTGMPTGTWSVKAVKVAARCVDGSGATGIQLGVKSGGTVDSGVTQNASGYWQTKERLMQVNPVTGVAFTPAEIEALQINLRAKAL